MTTAPKDETVATRPPAERYYLGSLDGLRVVAFLAVFLHHLPAPAGMLFFSHHGWVGVDLFFAISAFLLFRLLEAENDKDGQIGIRNFYLRRVLRIYPLLVAYYLFRFVVEGGFQDGMGWARLVTTFASVDNIASWWWGYNYTVSAVGHLWTLSFEFQVYLLLPFLFLAWQRWGTRRFLWFLLAVEAVAIGLRVLAILYDAPRPGVEVIPYFRPESILLGLALAVGKPSWKPRWSVMVALVAGVVFVIVPEANRLLIYLPAGLMVAALVDAGLRARLLRAVLSWRVVRYLGTISYGLYVFHLVGIWGVVRGLPLLGLDALYNGPVILLLSLAVTIGLSALSYRYLERPFLTVKRRFTSVEGRTANP